MIYYLIATITPNGLAFDIDGLLISMTMDLATCRCLGRFGAAAERDRYLCTLFRASKLATAVSARRDESPLWGSAEDQNSLLVRAETFLFKPRTAGDLPLLFILPVIIKSSFSVMLQGSFAQPIMAQANLKLLNS